MLELLRGLLDKQIIKMQQILGRVMQSEAFKLLEGFCASQSWEYIKSGEIIFGYDEIKYLVNKDSEKRDVTIEEFYKMPEGQARLVITHQKFARADVEFLVEKFILSSDKASVTFSYRINRLKPVSGLDFLNKVKIYGASLIVKFFPETVNKMMFNNKEISQGVKASLLDNKITVDFTDAVRQSPLAQKRVLGYQALDFVQIIAFNIRDKGLGVRFNLEIPDWLKNIAVMLFSAVIRRKIYKMPAFGTSQTKTSWLSKLFRF